MKFYLNSISHSGGNSDDNILPIKSLLLLFLFYYNQSIATTYTAIGCPSSENWSGFTATTCPFWNGSTQLTSPPATGDNLIIPAGCIVNVIGNPLALNNAIILTVNGNLDFGNSNKLALPMGSVIIVGPEGNLNAGNGGGNNNNINIGTTAVWTAAIGNVSGPFTLNSSCTLTGNNPNTYLPAGCGTILLPIELLDFTGDCVTNGVLLNWSTAAEINNDYFLIEKSNDGYEWEQIVKIKGVVNSCTTTKYVHFDYTDQNNLNYYRMSQIDINGQKKVFKAIDVYCNNTDFKNQMILYPNPSSTELNVVLSLSNSATDATITLVNISGQLIFETKADLIKGVNSFVFPINIPSGFYTVLFSSNNITIPAQKLMVIKSKKL